MPIGADAFTVALIIMFTVAPESMSPSDILNGFETMLAHVPPEFREYCGLISRLNQGASILSVNTALIAVSGPLLVTVMVYVTCSPALTCESPSFCTSRSAPKMCIWVLLEVVYSLPPEVVEV